MERVVVQITLFGLLLASVATLPNKDDWDIYSFHINSTVTSRYATTVITSRVANRIDESKEIEFHIRIPKNAFISKFRMFIDGQEYDGVVKAKEQAQQQYSEAVSRGQSAGIISSVGRTMEDFKTSVTVAAHKKVTFELTYEELLKRRLGNYELQIYARPMQPVKDFKVDVYIHEKAGINSIMVKGGLSTQSLANAITKTHLDKQAWVYFYPTEDQQKTCDSCGKEGMNGDLVIVYDVNRDTSMGDIKTSDGYFVHHFAPAGLTPIPKNVVFVIDQSGSMHGRKIEQTRIALNHILNDLGEEDFFGLITFDSNLFHWKRELVQASKENLESAKEFARNIQERGATDINAAVLEGTRMLNVHPREGSASILILLTDGDPTSGVTNLKAILANVREAIADKFPLYCLGFGMDVNFDFLQKMSLQNNGVARRIYEDSDADLQLKGFYKEVATPLLTDVTLTYMGGTNLTKTNFSQYYNGSEIVVAGQIADNNIETFIPQVVAISGTRRMIFSDTNASTESAERASDVHIQRVWAYLTVKQLLEQELQLSGSEKKKVKDDALALSLKYSFVTPLTSMVVTKPPGESTDVLHKPKEGVAPHQELLRGHSNPMARQRHPGVLRTSYTSMFPVRTNSMPKRISVSHDYFYHDLKSGIPGLPGPPGPPGLPGMAYSPTRDDSRVYSKTSMIRPNGGSAGISGMAYEPEVHLITSPILPNTVTVPLSHRFLLKADSQSLPLCFDVTGSKRLKLLHYPNRELYVNGQLDSIANGGFTKIVVRLNANQSVQIDTSEIIVSDGLSLTQHTGEDLIIAGSVTVIKRNKELDVAAGDVRIVILIQEKDGEEFLWPAVRQRPSGNITEGILSLVPADYEVLQRTPLPTLKINNQEIDVTRSSAVDYSIVSHPTLDCWLISADTALQRSLDDFIVAQL